MIHDFCKIVKTRIKKLLDTDFIGGSIMIQNLLVIHDLESFKYFLFHTEKSSKYFKDVICSHQINQDCNI